MGRIWHGPYLIDGLYSTRAVIHGIRVDHSLFRGGSPHMLLVIIGGGGGGCYGGPQIPNYSTPHIPNPNFFDPSNPKSQNFWPLKSQIPKFFTPQIPNLSLNITKLLRIRTIISISWPSIYDTILDDVKHLCVSQNNIDHYNSTFVLLL